jgi:hypothetical protein
VQRSLDHDAGPLGIDFDILPLIPHERGEEDERPGPGIVREQFQDAGGVRFGQVTENGIADDIEALVQ